jgi:hypothetical protein
MGARNVRQIDAPPSRLVNVHDPLEKKQLQGLPNGWTSRRLHRQPGAVEACIERDAWNVQSQSPGVLVVQFEIAMHTGRMLTLR